MWAPLRSEVERNWWAWVCAPFSWRTAAHLHHINTTRLSTVTCWMFSHSSCRFICSWSSFTESGCRRRTTWWRMPKACFIGDKSGEYAGQSSTWTCWLSSKYLQTRATWGLALSCWKMCCSGEWRAGRSIAVFHRGIWLHSDYQQWKAVVCDIYGIFPPKPVRHHRHVSPCIWQWRQHSAPLCGTKHAAHLLCEVGNVTRH